MKTIPAILFMFFGFLTLGHSVLILNNFTKGEEVESDSFMMFFISAVGGSLQIIAAHFLL